MGCSSSLYIGMGSVLAFILTLVLLHYTGQWGAIVEFLSWIKKGFDWFLETAPKPLKMLMFFFLLITVLNFFINGFVELRYQCTTGDHLREPLSFFGGIGMVFECGLEKTGNITASEFDAYILNHTTEKRVVTDRGDVESMMRVECINVNPRLTFYGLDFLSVKHWALLLVIGFIIGMIKWAKQGS